MIQHNYHTAEGLRNLLARLGRYYWSPRPPQAYTKPNSKRSGLGSVRPLDCGAFNVAWACSDLDTDSSNEAHMKALQVYVDMTRITQAKVTENIQLTDILTLLTHNEFKLWYSQNSGFLPEFARNYIESGFEKHGIH